MIEKVTRKHNNYNFMKGYGYFSTCEQPVLYQDKKRSNLSHICDVKGKSYYSIFERINPGTTMGKYAQTASLENILNKIL